MTLPRSFLLLLLFLVSCVATTAPEDPAPGAVDARTRIYRGKERIRFDDMLAELAGADAVFLGEYHDDATTHFVESRVFEGLLDHRDDRVVLALEMFERDTQAALDGYLAGELTEDEFLDRARPWGNYRTGYRPLVELARRRGVPVVASNAPRSLARTISRGKAHAFQALKEPERSWLAPELLPNSRAYWQRFARAVRGHIEVDDVESEALLYSVQSLWDNTMGYSCAEALAAHPGFSVLHVNGGFHSRDHDGTVRQFQLRRPEASVLTVEVVPVTDLEYLNVRESSPRADFTVYAKRLGRGRHRGRYSVATAGRQQFRLHVPEQAKDADPVPLLVWLPDDGARAEDVLRYWRSALGSGAAVAVVEPTHRQRQERLYVAGQWYWPESFFEDLGPATLGLARLREYVMTHFPVDERTVLVGEGTGATVAIQAGLELGEDLATVLALEPRQYVKFRQTSLPDPPGEPIESPRVEIHASGDGVDWWQQEADAYGTVGHPIAVHSLSSGFDPRARIREALGLPAERSGQPVLVLAQGQLDDGEPAPSWARIVAQAIAGEEGRPLLARLREVPARVAEFGPGVLQDARVLAFAHDGPPAGFRAFAAEDLAGGHGIPLAPGDFGGTTILVTPARLSDEDFAAWSALEAADVLKKRSRFHHLRVARGADALPEVLQGLIDGGRSNALVVPASFCAPAATMSALAALATPFEDRLQIHWLPGLGAELARLIEEE